MENNYLILGIDPGLNFTGWGIVESLSNKENHISHGVIKTTKTLSLGERLNAIYENLNEIIDKYDPKEISVEKIVSKGFEREIVERTAHLLARSEYKRFQSAPGPKVTSKAFGRDRRFPLTSGFRNWN